MADYPHLLVETTSDGVRTITLDRADKLNAVNGALAAAFGPSGFASCVVGTRFVLTASQADGRPASEKGLSND